MSREELDVSGGEDETWKNVRLPEMGLALLSLLSVGGAAVEKAQHNGGLEISLAALSVVSLGAFVKRVHRPRTDSAPDTKASL